MRLHRFYVLQPLGEVVVINDNSVLKQWKNVFRYTQGVYVSLFNGDGNDYTYSIDSISSKDCTLTKLKQSPSYIPTKKITLYLSIIKKDNFELVVQKATELGITKIVPIISERSEKKNLNEDRLHKIAIEASEQCGRGNVPNISPITSLNSALENISKNEMAIVLNMNGSSWIDKTFQEKLKATDNISLFIGPEGGWSDNEEVLFKKQNLNASSLGSTVLRAETAAIVSCAFGLL